MKREYRGNGLLYSLFLMKVLRSGVKAFAQLINARAPAYFPAQEAGGIGFLTSADGAKYINTWLQLFPGKYVALSYGTNDANAMLTTVHKTKV